mgnify:CR=1 FL=1
MATRTLIIAAAAALMMLMAACGDSADESFGSPAQFDFGDDEQGWVPGFADLPVVDVESGSYDLDWGWGPLPSGNHDDSSSGCSATITFQRLSSVPARP